jgi:hypothetical protein
MTIHKVYNTSRGAEAYKAKYYANDDSVRIDEVDGKFFVISGYSGYQA